MSDQTKTRPFDLDQARKGAPFSCADGGKVEILKWDANITGDCPIVGLVGGEVVRWSIAGTSAAAWPEGYNLVMLPLGKCEGKSIFSGDTLHDENGDAFQVEAVDVHRPEWLARCTWPHHAPKVKYNGSLVEVTTAYWRALPFGESGQLDVQFQAAADRAIEVEVQAGRLIPAELRRGPAWFNTPKGMVYGSREAVFWLCDLYAGKEPAQPRRQGDSFMDMTPDHTIYGTAAALDYVRSLVKQ